MKEHANREITKRYRAREAVYALADIAEWTELFTDIELDQIEHIITRLSEIAKGDGS